MWGRCVPLPHPGLATTTAAGAGGGGRGAGGGRAGVAGGGQARRGGVPKSRSLALCSELTIEKGYSVTSSYYYYSGAQNWSTDLVKRSLAPHISATDVAIVTRGPWARVTVDHFRHLALQNV